MVIRGRGSDGRLPATLDRRARQRALKPAKECCCIATPTDNLSWNPQNAQKVGSCLRFLLHWLVGAFQIAAVLRNSLGSQVSLARGAPEPTGSLEM
jgi:hypothetical protein